MADKKNGNGTTPPNGHGKDIIKFPTLAERDRARREKMKQEESYRKQYKEAKKSAAKLQNPPFFNAGNLPPLTRALVVSFIFIHALLFLLVSPPARYNIFTMLGFVPGRFTGVESFFWFTPLTPLTHIFIHGGWMHLLFNVVMTLAMGTFFEKQYGAKRMSLFIIWCALAGVAFHFALSPFSVVPVIGASGAISGLFGVVILSLVMRGEMGPISKYGATPILVFWGVLMVAIGLLGGEDIAWQAHLGGYLGGLALYFLGRRFKRF